MFKFIHWYFFPFVFLPLLFNGKKRAIEVGEVPEHLPVDRWATLGRKLFYLSFIPFTLAMMRPQIIKDSKGDFNGIDISLVLDLSGSMAVEDIEPTRVEAAKSVIASFVETRENDRTALVIFAEGALPQVPLTNDYKVVKEKVQNLEVGTIPPNGTNIGLGLGVGVASLKQSNAKTKVIILLTDGSTPDTTSPISIAQLAKEMDIKIYTIGFGTEYPFVMGKDFFGNKVKQRVHVGVIDEKLLKKISNETDGKYYRAKDKATLKAILKEIDQLEKSKLSGKREPIADEYYIYFFLFGILLLTASFIFDEVIRTRVP